jgi:hypothetical protein
MMDRGKLSGHLKTNYRQMNVPEQFGIVPIDLVMSYDLRWLMIFMN